MAQGKYIGFCVIVHHCGATAGNSGALMQLCGARANIGNVAYWASNDPDFETKSRPNKQNVPENRDVLPFDFYIKPDSIICLPTSAFILSSERYN